MCYSRPKSINWLINDTLSKEEFETFWETCIFMQCPVLRMKSYQFSFDSSRQNYISIGQFLSTLDGLVTNYPHSLILQVIETDLNDVRAYSDVWLSYKNPLACHTAHKIINTLSVTLLRKIPTGIIIGYFRVENKKDNVRIEIFRNRAAVISKI